ncbi:T9SS type A sorting domain-containing protein [Flavobacterium sp. MK4S-17]|uniref:T9SS type A sorting domain-containing protein n=1 Tax=Flavobacterium sp. MK4S-17 TaxID=2543737 RepID=UPI0013593D47|nr:T9SS type A sorting domain-containing protein [Flavobacterium sp. MK4S-17]
MKKNYYYTFLFLIMSVQCMAQVAGCTDPLALNYNPAATINNGNCMYAPAAIAPDYSANLPNELEETSGLINWGDYLFTHNDNTDSNLYALDTITGVIEFEYPTGASNQDWEEITQDDDYVYIGDFGNNSNGNRTNLKILKISKAGLVSGNAQPEIINFAYSNQTDFSPSGSNSTDFDCEAFIAYRDSLYLFTKQWVSRQTSVYALPKTAGNYTAQLQTSYNVNGLITGAAYAEGKKIIVLSGYSNLLQPFLFLLYDFNFNDSDFFTGNKRKINVTLPFHQTEGISTINGLNYFITNERFVQPPFVNIPPKLHSFNLEAFLQPYIESLSVAAYHYDEVVSVYPNPATDKLYIDLKENTKTLTYNVIDMMGRVVQQGNLNFNTTTIPTINLADGMYILKLDNNSGINFIVKND